MGVNGIDMLKELLTAFCLLDDKGVIHISESKPGWIVGSAVGLGFKFLFEHIGY